MRSYKDGLIVLNINVFKSGVPNSVPGEPQSCRV